MKKLITKTLSMILMLAMTLSMTAMAASTTSTDTDPSAYAWYNYLHRDYVWNSGWNGDDSQTWNYYHNDNVVRGEISGRHLTDLEDSNVRYDYKLMTNYESPYGAPLETWNYLNSRYETTIASRWLNLLMSGFQMKNYNASEASEYLAAVTANLDDGFVYLYENYGESAAVKYAKSFYSISAGYTAFPGYSYAGCNAGRYGAKFLTAQEWLEALATDHIMPLVYQPINMAPMNGAPVANDPNKAVATKMTIQVNGVAKTFDIMTLHDTTYFKLADLANAMGFKYHQTNADINSGACIFNGANSTPQVRIRAHGNTYVKPGTKWTFVLVNGFAQELPAVISMDAHGNGDAYFRLRDIAKIMNFNVDWTPETGTTISNKSSFNEGISGKSGEHNGFAWDTSKWNEATHTFDK